MRVPLSWLRQFCPTERSAEELADLLTDHGVEVSSVIRPWQRLAGVVVARVLDVRDHPNADRLCVATVEAGSGERTVVVGVRNMGPGDLVPYAPPGATLPGLEGGLERRTIRGAPSDGMICSARELGISHDHSAILVLGNQSGATVHGDVAGPGQTVTGEMLGEGDDVKEALGLDDPVLDVEVFPNRPDLLSIVGVAREVAAATGDPFVVPDMSVAENAETAADAASVEVRDQRRCPRYVARVIRGVRVGPAPLRVQIRLTAAGMRPVSNVVDATNYVLLELGQPMHPFDLAGLAGRGIVVRRGEAGERLVTLDGVERILAEEDLLIADHEKAVGIAGVMGSEAAEVGGQTSDVLLESANFEPIGILRTGRRLGLRTEASTRFERGADPEMVSPAAARAAALMAEWAEGTVLAGEIEVGTVPTRRKVKLRPKRAAGLIGIPVSTDEALEAFERLALPATRKRDGILVEIPGHRPDLLREVDLIEEVARVGGYSRIPSTLPGVRQAGGLTREQRIRRGLRDVLAGIGLHEIVSGSFVPAADTGLFADGRAGAIRIANPVAEDQAYLRTSLLPGLLRAARRNIAHRRLAIRLFEIGTVFRASMDGEPRAEERVAVLLAGETAEEWPGERREPDFLDAKGILEHVLAMLGVADWSPGADPDPPFSPGRSAQVQLPGGNVGDVGEILPSVADRFKLPGRVTAVDLALAPLLLAASDEIAFRDISPFPPVHRDLAFVLDRDVAHAGRVRRALVEAAGELLDRVALFDVFEGRPLPEGKVSLAFSIELRAPDRTLTDDEADAVVRAIAERLAGDFGAELRTG